MLLSHATSVLYQNPLWTVATVLLCTFIVIGTYNIFFHPLSHVPGPLLCKLSGLPSFYHAWKGDHHIWLWRLHGIYGNRIRLRPDTVLFTSPTAYNAIYAPKANVQKAAFYRTYINANADVSIVTTISRPEHAKKRRLLNLIFNEKSLRAAAGFIIKHVDRWNELTLERAVDEDGWTEPIDFADWTDKLVFDIMADLSFGKPFGIKEPGANPLKSMPHNIVKYMSFIYPLSRIPFLHVLLYLKPRGLDALLALSSPPEVKSYFAFVAASVQARIAQQKLLRTQPEAAHRLDMFHFLYEARDSTTGAPAYPSESHLRGEVNLLIVAGTDTTSISLCGLFFYLTRYPHTCDILVREVRAAFAQYTDIVQGAPLSDCTYLRAAIDEALRLTPAAPSELPREVLAGGIAIDGVLYPAGIVVGTGDWAQSRDPCVWGADAHVFRPERWVATGEPGRTEADVEARRKMFHAFGQGPHSCVGKNLAMLELMLVVARTLWRFEVRGVEGDTLGEGREEADKKQFQLRDAFISVREGPMLQFRRRA